jgi:DNA-binding transcriptional ArsR family regulator
MSSEDLAGPGSGGPGNGGRPPESREFTDARAFRALAHPVRVALIEALAEGPQTATEAGERTGETPTTCSFHLRQLAKYGFVEETGGGRGRARPWRLTSFGMSFAPASGDAAAVAASDTALRMFRQRQLARYEAWRATRGAYPAGWRDGAADAQYTFHLTADELRQMNAEVHEVLVRWWRLEGRAQDPSRRPPGSAPVEALWFNYPTAPPERPAVTRARQEPPSPPG